MENNINSSINITNINDMQKMRMIMSIITARELVKAILKNREEDTEKQKTI